MITAKLLDDVMKNYFTDRTYRGDKQTKTLEIKNALQDSDQAPLLLTEITSHNLSPEAEAFTILSIGISLGLALSEFVEKEKAS